MADAKAVENTPTTRRERNGAVLTIVMNRPDAMNAVSPELRHQLAEDMKIAAFDPAIRAVVITGEGRGFCAGADLKSVQEPKRVEDVLNTEYGAYISTIMTMDKPVIAAVNGAAAGIGMTLALACDLMVMGETAYLMSAFANISLVPDGGLTWLLSRKLGYARSYEACIEAQKLSARQCLDWGLANRVVADDNVRQEAETWAEGLAERAPLALGMTKRAFRRAMNSTFQDAAQFEAMLQNQALQSEDFREGVAAFMEKRKPKFQGK
ncbi:MAG: enoyl-CoA hydratase-related protein [Pseudomonadota bacterium]